MSSAATNSPWRAGRLTRTPAGGRPRLMFGRMYEDHDVELGLFPPGGRVLAIASAGDTAAALARAGHQVTAVDLNPVQLAYARARLDGAPAVTGTAERIMAIGRLAAGAVLAAWRPAALAAFLRLDAPAAQADWWHRELDRPAVRALARTAMAPLPAVLPNGLSRAVPTRFDRVLLRRIGAGVARYPNVDNPWAWRLLLGRERVEEPLRAGGVEWVHADIVEHLGAVPAGWYDAVTLSNVLDGPAPAFAARLATALRHAVRPGGPVVLRTVQDRSPLPGQPLDDRSLLWGAVTRVHIGD